MSDPYHGAMPAPKFERNERVFHRWFGRGRITKAYPAFPKPDGSNDALPQCYDVLFDRTGHTAEMLEERWIEPLAE